MTSAAIELPDQVRQMRDAGAIFVVNHSGGKDSQAMTILLRRHIPAAQIVVVHADLVEVDWPGVAEHIADTCQGLEVVTCTAKTNFFDMVERRQMFPTPKYRQCTSDLKRTPIGVMVRRLCRERANNLVVQCTGERAEESSNRARAIPLRPDNELSKAGRQVLRWLPIHGLTEAEVFATIAEAGERPHWAYAAGMSRLSCCFCIMASKADLRTAAKLRPALYARYVATERRLNFTLHPSQVPLERLTGILADPTGLVAKARAATCEIEDQVEDLVATLPAFLKRAPALAT